MTTTAAIFYHPEGYTTSGPKLMGRNAAGESFLRGFFAHSTAREFHVQVQSREHASDFHARAMQAGRREPVTAVMADGLAALRGPGALYLPGPDLAQHARYRSLFAPDGWSLCGITHTTASARAMDSIAAMLTAPVQPFDCLICTSEAVRSNVLTLLQREAEFLKERLGATRIVVPNLPVIPLGIVTADFEHSAQTRAEAREALGIAKGDITVLFAGRLSFHAKAHPLAMYLALEKAAHALPEGAKLHLVECGWHANDHIARAFTAAAALACPSVRMVTLDGRLSADRRRAWASADIFCSLSDNIQETFGLVPIEAMAAGLPVVVSDWDGYRDTVRDGIDGFRVPTIMPAPGLGTDLAARHALELDTYDVYCGNTCMLVSVDIDATATAFARLIASPELRAEMGAAGRARARAEYDWGRIIPRYEALWAELAERRKAEAAKTPPSIVPWPQRMDPFAGFATYPTMQLTASTMVELARTDAVAEFRRLWPLEMVRFTRTTLPDEAELEALLEALAAGPVTATLAVQGFAHERRLKVLRSLTFLSKLGLVRLTTPPAEA